MSKVHYFQRFSQKENVVTNNTLLLFSRLYAYNPFKFEDFLNGILQDKASVDVGVSFQQQIKSPEQSVPDGLLSQQSFKVVIETKLYSEPHFDQLRGHLGVFSNQDTQVLLLLNLTELSFEFQTKVETFIREFSQGKDKKIAVVCVTFEKVIESFKAVLAERDYEMQELVKDYESFCAESDLLPRTKHLMRAVPCGLTLEENFEFNLYYDPANKVYKEHKYIGIYSDKCIRGVGEIENVITADYIHPNLQIIEFISPVTDDQQERIIKVIAKAKENNGWDISKGMKFFLVKKFYETEFRKQSKGPMRSKQYFDLEEVLNNPKLPDVAEIAEILKTKSWGNHS